MVHSIFDLKGSKDPRSKGFKKTGISINLSLKMVLDPGSAVYDLVRDDTKGALNPLLLGSFDPSLVL